MRTLLRLLWLRFAAAVACLEFDKCDKQQPLCRVL
jgi:hypothetical protein